MSGYLRLVSHLVSSPNLVSPLCGSEEKYDMHSSYRDPSICRATMVWVSNQSGVAITVRITNTTGGMNNVFQIAAGAAETFPDNHWQRGGDELATIAQIGGNRVDVAVRKDAYVRVVGNAILAIQDFSSIPLN